MACNNKCKKIGEATIGLSLIVGCTICPPFSEDARYSDNTVKLFKYKFRKLGIR